MRRDPKSPVRTTSGTMSVTEIETRVSLLEPGIVLMVEVPNGTEETFAILLDSARAIGAPFKRWAMVVDLTEVIERPRGRYLEMIRRESIAKVGSEGEPMLLALVQPGSAFMRTVLGFVLGRMSGHVSVHATREAATAACRAALGGREHTQHAK